MFDTGDVRARLVKGEVVLGGWLSTNSVACAEVMAYAGFDWIGIDVEHTASSVADVENIVKAVKLHNVKPIARVFDCGAMSIRRLLDAGVEGIIVPMVRTADDAKQAVSVAKYPPLGKRGAGTGAANVYGAKLGDYIKTANDGTLVIMMVETREAVENIDAILEVDGVDGVFLGPMDLSASYGIMGKIGDPIISGAIDKVFAACKAHGKAAGIHVLAKDVEVLRNSIERGAAFLALSYDSNLVYQGSLEMLAAARQAIQS